MITRLYITLSLHAEVFFILLLRLILGFIVIRAVAVMQPEQ